MISQTLFSSREDSYPTWRFFSLLELSLPDTLEFWNIMNFLRLAMNECWVWISSGTAHSDLVSLHGHQYLSWQTLIFFWKLNSYAVVWLHCICTTKQPGWPFDWDCTHCCNLQCSSFLFKTNCICSQKQVDKFIKVI